MGPNLFDNFEEEPQIALTPLIDCLFMLNPTAPTAVRVSRVALRISLLPPAIVTAAPCRSFR